MNKLQTQLTDEANTKLNRPSGLLESAANIGGRSSAFDTSTAEAIIVVDRDLRPALIVRNNSFEQPTLKSWKTTLNAHRTTLEHALLSVGRLELVNHPTLPYGGTAWMIGDGRLAVTNRHVGELFAVKQGQSFVFRKIPGSTLGAKLDFREEFNVAASKEISVEKVLFIAPPGDNEPDVAILRLAKNSALPDPLVLADAKAKKDQAVAVIGYPASDPRNPAAALSTIFGSVFEVKRLAPGFVTKAAAGFVFQHDCSTLGGNSGSVVLDIATGRALGLHFGGRFRQANFAVAAERLKKILKDLKVQIAVPIAVHEAPKAKSLPKNQFAGRTGYNAKFLGTAASKLVPLPKLGAAAKNDLAKVEGAADNLLRYTHFSIAMSASRRLCFFTAANIDGKTAINIRRTEDVWNLDPRIAKENQIGNELYVDNDLDRGHMVRRLDPVWGKDAEQANDDTFVYTNATPQHARLNQKTWNDLEDYILSNTSDEGLKVNVFTGPVFADDDPEYRDVLLPQQFWKVVSVVNGDTGKLHATAYVLSQKDLISDLEFVFGQFRTYQLPIADLEARTGLNFGKLRNFDPLKSQETFAIREIAKLEDVVL